MTPDGLLRNQAPGQACLLIYDGQCQLCVAAKQKLEQAGVGRAGSNVRFISYQSDEARQALGSTYRPGRPDMAFLVKPSGGICQGLEAFLPFVPSLPGGRVVLWFLRAPQVKRLAEWGYQLLARHRYRLFGEVQPQQGRR